MHLLISYHANVNLFIILSYTKYMNFTFIIHKKKRIQSSLFEALVWCFQFKRFAAAPVLCDRKSKAAQLRGMSVMRELAKVLVDCLLG